MNSRWRCKQALAMGTILLIVASGVVHAETNKYGIRLISPPDGVSIDPSLDFSGQLLAYSTTSTNLTGIPPDYCQSDGETGPCSQIVIQDLASGVAKVISKDEAGRPGFGPSNTPQLNSTGDALVFASRAPLLQQAQGNMSNFFVATLPSLAMQQANVGSNGPARPEQRGDDPAFGTVCRIWCGQPSIAAESNHVAFSSWSANLVPNDNNSRPDVFVRDLRTGKTTLVSQASDGGTANDASFENSAGRYISADGSRIVFTSASSNLVAGKVPPCPASTNSWPYPPRSCPQVYLRDLATNTTYLVSRDANGFPGNAMSTAAVISDDGNWVAYVSAASNIVESANGHVQAILVDLRTWDYKVVSRGSDGNLSDGDAGWLSISRDGSALAFVSSARSLGASGGTPQLYVYERHAERVHFASHTIDDIPPNGYVHSISLAGNGQSVAFAGIGSGWVQGASGANIYIVDLDNFRSTTEPGGNGIVILGALAIGGLVGAVWLGLRGRKK